jgi:hypothetical protein
MELLAVLDSWWGSTGWRRIVAGILKFGVIELGISVLVLLLIDICLRLVLSIPVLPKLPIVQDQNLLGGLSFVVVYNAVSCNFVRESE